MKNFITTFQAIDKTDGHLKTFVGKYIMANNEQEANDICKVSFPYLSVVGELIKEVDEITGLEINNQLN